jgi:E3 ubiquitin-protein ligase RNF31
MNGSIDILKQMGYTKELKDGLCFPDDVPKPDVDRVKDLAADLFLAKIETDDLINDRHPYFLIERFVPEQNRMEASSAMNQPTLTKLVRLLQVIFNNYLPKAK